MSSAVAVAPAGAIETIPTKVEWKNRKPTDIMCGAIYLIGLLAWLGLGFSFMASSVPTWETDSDGNIVGFSPEVKEKASECCSYLRGQQDTADTTYNKDGAMCWNSERRGRHLFEQEADASYLGHRHLSGSGTFPSGGGMLDVFAIHPHVAFTMILAVIVMAISWILFLRKFARTVVWTCEAIKVVALGYLGYKANNNAFFYAMAAGYCVYLFCARKKLNFAATIISHSAKGLKENPQMVPALLLIKGFYVLQAMLFIQFFAKSMEVKEVEPVKRSLGSGEFYCDAGSEYTCEYDYSWDAQNANYCGNNGGMCLEYASGNYVVECEVVDPAWATSGRDFVMLFWLWSTMWYTQARLIVVANIIGSWHFHPEDKPGPMKAVNIACTTSFGTVSASALICAIVEQFHKWARLKWYHLLPPFVFFVGPLKIFLCILSWCFKTCLKMLTKFSVIVHVFTGSSFMGSAKKCFGIMKRHFVGGFITEASSAAIMKIFSLVMSVAFCFSTWAWVDDLFFNKAMACNSGALYDDDSGTCSDGSWPRWKTVPGVAPDNFLWILWVLLASFNIYYPLIGIFFITILDGLFSSIEGLDPGYWVSPLCAIFVGCIAKLFFDYMGGVILDTIDVMFMCFAVDKDNNVDLSKSEFSAIIMELPGVNKVANPMTNDPNAALLVQGGGPAGAGMPVQAGQFVAPPTSGVPQGTVEGFAPPGGGQMMMQPAQGQPMMMMQP
eukprot:CAMPEP_0182462158 /NCGR_PEP_ID=MMETSP1319-20130603/6508_1 /TAXON_ID=172717 /ORGANISM="Bolidomonas pacifica, Strain RCC208" /LENGTH=723 /DNA_ID=CAMNT_0024661551 /DNA_START=46 /DNA_END=2214 /DNA_ORIENTATION=-